MKLIIFDIKLKEIKLSINLDGYILIKFNKMYKYVEKCNIFI